MRTILSVVLLCLAIGGSCTVASANTLINKPPDLGAIWLPVGNATGGSYVYLNSFVAPAGDTVVDKLGTWLMPFDWNGGPQHSEVAFQVWADNFGPDLNQIVASTDDLSTETAGLNLYVLDVTSGPAVLTPGNTYWFVINGMNRGDASYDQYQTGGHTQNSVYNDFGTFWYSNYPDASIFDGPAQLPEMAFQVHLVSVPEPATLGGFLGLGLAMLVARRRR